MTSEKIGWLPYTGTIVCWLSSLLAFTPAVGLFFLPIALLGGLLVWFSQLSVRAKLVRGLLPLLVPIAFYSWFFVTHYVP